MSARPKGRRVAAETTYETPVRRPRVIDVAREAGVSTATVDRVLHARPSVRPATVQRVLKAAGRLDYLPEADLHARTAPEPMQLVFLLPAGTNPYLQMLGDYIGYTKDAWVPFNVRCRCHFIDSFDPRVLAAGLMRQGRAADGIAFMALEHPLVREAVDALAARGVPVVTLISDLSNSQRVAY